jgi:hypothetical protein
LLISEAVDFHREVTMRRLAERTKPLPSRVCRSKRID